MAQNVTIAGASYTDVTAIEVPKTTSGVASFHDVTDTTATADDVAVGKYFYTAAGVKTEGTATIGGAVESDVNFYDYDGTLVKSYTAADFANVTAMPDNPTHAGLTAQGWNWSLSEAKTYVNTYGKLNIGQMYTTTASNTKIYIELKDGRLSPCLGLCVNGTCDIDWGDGTAHGSLTGTSSTSEVKLATHTYSSVGNYTITVSNGEIGIYGHDQYYSMLLTFNGDTSYKDRWRVYLNSIIAVELGSNVVSINDKAFYYCYSLEYVTIPSSVTSIGANAFYGCYSLAAVAMPNSILSISNFAFYNSKSLKFITIPSSVTSFGTGSEFSSCSALITIALPNSISAFGNSVFSTCYSLTNITLPSNITGIGSSMFNACSALRYVVIPSGVTVIGANAFYGCYTLESFDMPNGVTEIGKYAFYYCYSLRSFTLPASLTTYGSNILYYCYSLASVTLENGLTTIPSRIFQGCESLTSLTIPSSVTSIGSNAIYDCYGLKYIRFLSDTPPTAQSNGTFTHLPNDCVLYVPSASFSQYTSATNYPAYGGSVTYIGE